MVPAFVVRCRVVPEVEERQTPDRLLRQRKFIDRPVHEVGGVGGLVEVAAGRSVDRRELHGRIGSSPPAEPLGERSPAFPGLRPELIRDLEECAPVIAVHAGHDVFQIVGVLHPVLPAEPWGEFLQQIHTWHRAETGHIQEYHPRRRGDGLSPQNPGRQRRRQRTDSP